MKKIISSGIYICSILVSIFLFSLKAHALTATPTSSGPVGITVSPAFQQVNVNQSELSHPVTFTITNNTGATQDLKLTTQDFNTLSETGGLFFVGANPTQLEKKYGLAKWVSLPQTEMTIAPKQTAKVEADILNLPDLAPGGHYGALMISLNDNSTNPGQNNVSLHPIASSLMFVTKLGGDTHILDLSNVYVNRTLLKLPSSVTLRFKNDGNTHLIPRGIISITGPGGKLVSRGIINEDSDIMLPQTYRLYGVPLTQISSDERPGKYTLRVDYRFDGINQYRSYQQSFELWPVINIVEGLILGVLLTGISIWIVNHKLSRKK